MKKWTSVGLILLMCTVVNAKEYHVSKSGNDANNGSAASPFKTISAAAQIAQPGDTITVHQGVYRERINPPRGGTSDDKRIVYRAAPGEKVTIKGSEIIEGWRKAQNDTWKVMIPNSFFGDFNPYSDLVSGDWFNGMGREHHTGAVYLNGHWLTEASNLEHVLKPIGAKASAYAPGGAHRPSLLNVVWIKPNTQILAASFTDQHGVRKAACSEGGECIGWLEHEDWVRYEGVDFSRRTQKIELRAASASKGGIIEIRLDAPNGKLLGACTIPNTGGWQAWESFEAKITPTSGMKTLCLVFIDADVKPESDDDVGEDVTDLRLWFSEVNATHTTIWAQFMAINPNEHLVEINVREAVFYPEKTGINYITVRGFSMMHAAPNWAPPTAEQVGLIGVNWSKGWIIENNDIRYAVCTGITLGKHGDKYDNTSADTAEGYVKTIERGLERGWSKENIGHHIVRNNHIAHFEQAGIVGSLGPVFCTITGNTIHDIHVRRLFSGAEMAGIKFHGAIDTVISNNYIYHTCLGLWLDWMTQGTRVTKNLFHDNGNDLFVEVNQGPFLVDNNLFLSGGSIAVNSHGGAYVHNLINGNVNVAHGEGRLTPYHKAHSTEIAGLAPNPSGDDRYYNNLVVNVGLKAYDPAKLPVFMDGNVFLKGAKPSKHEFNPLVQSEVDPEIKLVEKSDGMYLQITPDKAWTRQQRQLVSTDMLGKAKTPDLKYEQPDGSPYRIDTDYLGRKRNSANPCAGPFEYTGNGKLELKVVF